MCFKERVRKQDSKIILQNAAAFVVYTLAMTVPLILNTQIGNKAHSNVVEISACKRIQVSEILNLI